MELRNPFGLRDGQVIMIEDVPNGQNGLRCNCICPACKEPFEARMGEVRRHHFAHSGQGCDEVNAYLMGLYMLLNEYLSSKHPLYLPPVIVEFELSAHYYLTNTNIYDHISLLSATVDDSHEIMLFDRTKVVFDDSQIVTGTNGRPKAIRATSHGKQLAIRITPPDTVCKFGEVSRYQDFPTIEIDLANAADMIQQSQKDAVFKYLMNKHSIYRWIYNPRITEAFPRIMKRSKAYYDAAQARMKKEEEERKAKAERMRREAEQMRKKLEEKEEAAAAERLKKADEARFIKEYGYEIGLSDVKDKFTQQTSIVRDRFGKRWVQCEKCGVIKRDFEFPVYGGTGRVNLGICRECSRKQR